MTEGIVEIHRNGELIARLVKADALWVSAGLSFLSEESDFLQVGTWLYGAGKELPGHTHNRFERIGQRTQEAVFVVAGNLIAHVYDDVGELLEDLPMSAGDLLVCLNGGHGYSIMTDGTRVLEFKNGPYFGPEVDRRRFDRA